MLKVVIKVDLTKHLVGAISADDFYPEINIDNILGAVSSILEIPVLYIRSKARGKDLVNARKLYCLLARSYTGATLKDIGKLVNYAHDTVIYSVKMAEHFIQYEHEFRKKYISIKERLNLK